ncbi:hypothetical protein HDU97_005099 [Phlyctochytrium planicorne]|nr:hypothetical protein HDU97_005099 [Phlyctochytrium planicorne]
MEQRLASSIAQVNGVGDVFVRKGAGGRSSVSGGSKCHIATVFGCTGFLGRYLVNSLGKKGNQVITPYRGSDDEKRHLKVMGDLGQIVQLRFDLRNEDQLASCIKHSDTVINLIGANGSTKNFKLSQVHVDGARRIAKMSRELGVSKLIHMSALGADTASPSSFLRTKAEGEIAVREEFPNSVIVRPSTMYGHEDRFLNLMAYYAKYSPIGFPIFNDGKTVVRPVYVCASSKSQTNESQKVNDVAVAISRIAADPKIQGKTFELFGPRAYYYENVAKFFLNVTRRDPTVWHCPRAVGKLLGFAFDTISLHSPILSKELVEKYYASEVPTGALTFADLNMQPLVLEETILKFIKKYRPAEFQLASFETDVKKFIKNDLSIKA